jgi:hypothetical protein
MAQTDRSMRAAFIINRVYLLDVLWEMVKKGSNASMLTTGRRTTKVKNKESEREASHSKQKSKWTNNAQGKK